MMRRVFAIGLTAVLAAAGMSAAYAQTARPVPRGTRPLRQHQVRPVPVPAALAWRAVHTGSHTIYGQIAGITGNILTVRMRNGRSAKVDAAAAVAHGDISAPLFVGKLVSVDGEVRNGTFTAAHVFRLENLYQLPNDH